MKKNTSKITFDASIVAVVLMALAVAMKSSFGWEWGVTVFAVWVNIIWTLSLMILVIMSTRYKNTVRATWQNHSVYKSIMNFIMIGTIIIFAWYEQLWYTFSVVLVLFVARRIKQFLIWRMNSASY